MSIRTSYYHYVILQPNVIHLQVYISIVVVFPFSPSMESNSEHDSTLNQLLVELDGQWFNKSNCCYTVHVCV